MINWNNDKRLGFGTMRLPKRDGKIDIEKFKELADYFIAHGFTYFDTAYVYDGAEEALRKAVVERYPRSSYTVADKMAGFKLSDKFSAEDMFNQSLERCGVGYFDYYLLHSLQPSRYRCYDDNGCWEFCKQKKAEGKIKNFGFSFHGGPELLDEILTLHPEVDFVQLQLNYVDWNSNAIYSGENYAVAEKHNKDIVVMEPAKGGILANIKPEAAALFRNLDSKASPASYAFRFVGSLPNVKMILSGMNELNQVVDNVNIFSDFQYLDDSEQQVIVKVRDKLLEADVIPCTGCRYCCTDCPQKINIPEIFKAYNMYLTFGEHTRPKLYYDGIVLTGSGLASDCVSCGQCESACPQHINIREKIKECAAYLDGSKK